MTKLLLTVQDNYTNFMDLKARGFRVDLNGACTQLTVELEPETALETAVRLIQPAVRRAVELTAWGAGVFLVQPAEVRYV